MKLSPTAERFVLHWGEMGARWGMNRTVSQIHALLYLSDAPLTAEEIVDTLSVARSNVSTSLKELQAWGLVTVRRELGDRRDHFQAVQDVWQIFQLIVEGRRRREIDPTLSMLRQCMLDEDPQLDPGTRSRIKGVLEFLELLTGWHDDMKTLPGPVIKRLLKMGAAVQKVFSKTGRSRQETGKR